MSHIRQTALLIGQGITLVIKSFRLFIGWLFGLAFLSPSGVALLIFLLGIFIVRQGFVTLYDNPQQTWTQLLRDLYADGGAELISIAVIAFILDWLARRRSMRERKRDLIIQVGSPDNDFAREAVRHMRRRGWVMDGTLAGADLKGANLEHVDLWGGDLTRADLSGANLHEARLMGVNFSRATMTRTILSGADMEEARLVRTRLGGGDLSGAQLTFADLRDAYLEEADLRGADLRNANLSRADLDRANLTNADLRGAELAGVRCDGATILPDGAAWSSGVDLARFTDVTHPDYWQPSTESV